jgi:hypothetical protein
VCLGSQRSASGVSGGGGSTQAAGSKVEERAGEAALAADVSGCRDRCAFFVERHRCIAGSVRRSKERACRRGSGVLSGGAIVISIELVSSERLTEQLDAEAAGLKGGNRQTLRSTRVSFTARLHLSLVNFRLQIRWIWCFDS